MNCGKTSVYNDSSHYVRCSKCNNIEVYEYMNLIEYLLFKYTAWRECWNLYELQTTYSKHALEKKRKKYLLNSDLSKQKTKQTWS
jgi:hypothetical protein